MKKLLTRLFIAMLILTFTPTMNTQAKAKIKLNKTKISLQRGKTYTLKVKGTKKKVKWSSNKKTIATVTRKGKVTAQKQGTAVITASCGEYKVTCKITVKNPSLKLTKSSATVKVGKTTKISAKATPSGKVTYKSSNSKIATVSSKGVVKGKKKGTAKITGSWNGVKKVFTVKVK